jgi:hypothetical protein
LKSRVLIGARRQFILTRLRTLGIAGQLFWLGKGSRVGSFSTRWGVHRIVAVSVALVAALTITAYDASAEPPEEIGVEFQLFHSESGGVHVFGYALSPRVMEDERVVQYFERQRLESHPENGGPYDVLLGRLGSEQARERGLIDTEYFEPLKEDEYPDPDCLYFGQTGHQICGGFKDHWESHGLDLGDEATSREESLALFGYPISREFTDPETGLTVQYFERAVFEYHHEQAGTPYEILLERLGAPLWEERRQFAELAPEPEPTTDPELQSAPASGIGQQIAELAQQFVGYPYVWGATGPNAFDCTGFTFYVVNQVIGGGYSRDMFTQAATGTPVSRDDLQPGDIVFQQNTYRAGLSHAGIYLGGGKFVHAANPGTGVIVSDLWDGYWGPRFHSARRITG